jgi:hypothetical protein
MRASEIITEKCWKGYEKKGMKTMFGKRVPNCVKKEDVDFCVNCGGLVFAESLNENLKKWFKDKWVRFGPDGKIRGDCARGSARKASLNAYRDPKQTHWARKAGSPRPAGSVDKIQTRTDVVKPRTSLPRRNNLHSRQICYILVG